MLETGNRKNCAQRPQRWLMLSSWHMVALDFDACHKPARLLRLLICIRQHWQSLVSNRQHSGGKRECGARKDTKQLFTSQQCPTPYLATDLSPRPCPSCARSCVAVGCSSRTTATYTTATVGAALPLVPLARPFLLKGSCCSSGPFCQNGLSNLAGDCDKLMLFCVVAR